MVEVVGSGSALDLLTQGVLELGACVIFLAYRLGATQDFVQCFQ